MIPALVDLLAQAAHVAVHVIGAARVLIVPDTVLNLLPGEHLFLVAQQVLQDGELLGQQGDLLPAPGDPPLGCVQGQVAGGEQVGALAGVLAGHGPDAGQQLVKVEGLDQVVVRPQVQALHPVRHAVPGGEEENRGVHPLLPQFPHQGIAVLLGHHHVQEDAIVLRPQQVELGILPVMAAIHGIAGFFEHLLEQQVQVPLILYHQDAHGVFPSFLNARPGNGMGRQG